MDRNEIIKVAESQLLEKEIPQGSNKQKFGQWYGMNGYAWCAMFVSWVYDKAGSPFSTPNAPNGFHGCAAGYNYWKSQRKITLDPKPADIVLFDWNKDGHSDHTGIFKGWLDEKKQYFYAIEGNTAVGDDSNGGQVMIRKRHISMVRAFVNILDEDVFTPSVLKKGDVGGAVKELQKLLQKYGHTLIVDGEFGVVTEICVKTFQSQKGLEPDGIVGKNTMAALKANAV